MLEKLFLEGFNLENFLEISSIDEKEKFLEVLNKIKFSDETKNKILDINENINIVASVETWCPYARVFIATIKKMNELNSKIKFSFVTMGRGLMNIVDFLEIDEDDFVVPTALILDKNYIFKKSFIGFPKKYLECGLGENKENYFSGLKADEIVDDIL